MPKIPVYQQQVGPADMPGVRLGTNYTPDMFDGGMAQGMKAVSGALQDVNTAAGNILKKKNAIWVQERLSKLTQQYDTFTYGSPDGQVSGVLTSKGLAAAEAARTAPEFLDKAVSDLTGDAPSQDAVTEFRLRAAAVRQSTSSTIARHAATEVNLYHAEAAQGNAQVQIESIAADYNQSPEAIDQAIMDRVAPSILEAARLTGKPTEEAMREAKASTYALVITQTLASGNTRRAKELLGREDWHDALDAETRAKLTDKIRTEVIAQESLTEAQALVVKGIGEREAKRIIDEKFGDDIRMRDATWTRYKQEATFLEQEKEESKKARLGNLYKALYTETDPQKRLDMVMRANPEDFHSALVFAESLNKPPADNPADKENRKRYDAVINAELRRMVDADMFSTEHEIYAKASELGVQEISNISDSVSYWKGGGGGLKDSEVRTMFKEMTGDDASSEPEKFAAVYDYISTFAPKAEGRQIPPETIRKLMGDALLTWDPGILTSERTNAEWVAENKQKLDEFDGANLYDFKPEIPPATRAEIEKYLRANNKDASLASVRKYYIHKYMGIPVPKQGAY